MATSLEQFNRELRAFEAKREVVKQLRKELRRPVPAVTEAVAARALDTLPKRGGLNAYIAATKVIASFRSSARSASVRLKGSRRSLWRKTDVNAIDRGRARHPSWGRYGKGQWHTQAVTPGFFSKTTTEAHQWREAALKALDAALATIRRG